MCVLDCVCECVFMDEMEMILLCQKQTPIFLLSLLLGAEGGGGVRAFFSGLVSGTHSVPELTTVKMDQTVFLHVDFLSCECVSMLLYFLCIGSLLAHSQWNSALFCNTTERITLLIGALAAADGLRFQINQFRFVLFLHLALCVGLVPDTTPIVYKEASTAFNVV